MKKQKELAIIGIGCRLPGNVNSAEQFWNFLCDAQDAIVPVPETRWDVRKYYDENPDKPGKSYVKEGGFLHQNIREFDPEFFKISPREAMTMDPQQRLLLETAWEAIEDSGTPLQQLQNLRTGVFIGGFCLDSKLIQLDSNNKENINSFTSAGITLCILSNRISHAFDLTGPSISIDTACSSSLVATHLACQSIWNDDADVALIGGVNVMMRPEYFVGMCKGRFLSQRARCHAFDSRADGYVRGEGCGVVLIKPLEKALQDNDRIYSVILGSGVNQDGHTAGISLPNSEAQEKLIKSTYNKSGVLPNQVNYVEAHGTGTQQGDYAEAMALQNVFQHNEDHCLVGSVKTKIGHLEAASGIASLIKTSMVLHYKTVPANLHFLNPNEKIPFDVLKIKVATHLQSLPNTISPHYAGINSFGYGGTNAHVILRSEVTTRKQVKPINWPVIYPLSARSESAIKAMARIYRDILQEEKFESSQFCNMFYTLACRRTHHEHSLAVIGTNQIEIQAGLDAFARGEFSSHVIYNKTPVLDKNLCWVYTGMGPQWWGMGQQLYRENGIFTEWVDRCELIFKDYSGWSLTQELLRDENESKVARSDVAQPLNFVIQTGLTEILRHFGIFPDCVVGHSVGEISAAYVAGALSLEDALLISYHRSRLQQTCAGTGGMLAANISPEKAQPFLQRYPTIAIAAVNATDAITLAGEQTVLQKIADALTQADIFNRMLKVDIAYHSPEMDPIETELLQALQKIKPVKTNIALYSTVTGNLIEGHTLDAAYWWRNVRQSVLFKDAIDRLLQPERFNILVEIGPHPVMKNYLVECFEQSELLGKPLFSLHRAQEETLRIYTLLSELYTVGCELNWSEFLPQGGELISLPHYPWQRQPCWLETDFTESNRTVESPYLFLSKKLNYPRPSWEVELNDQFFPYMTDHKLDQMTVFPGAGFVEAALQITHEVHNTDQLVLSEIRFENMLIAKKEKTQTILSEYNSENKSYTIWSTEGMGGAWIAHSKGKILQEHSDLGHFSLKDLQTHCNESVDPELIYHLFHKEGLQYGSQFQCISTLWRSSENEILAKLNLPFIDEKSAYFIHPAILDAAFHSLMAIENNLTHQSPYVPIKIGKITLDGHVGNNVWAYTRIKERNDEFIREEIFLLDDSGKVLCQIDDFVCQRLPLNDSGHSVARLAQKLYKPQWHRESLHFVSGINEKTTVLALIKEHTVLSRAVLEELKFTQCHLIVLEGMINEACITKTISEYNDKNLLFVYFASDTETSLPTKNDYTALLDNCIALTEIAKFLHTKNDAFNRLIVVTQNAKIIAEEDTGFNRASAALSSVGFLMNNELLGLSAKSIDLPAHVSDVILEECALEVISKNKDIDVALRESGRYVMRLDPEDNMPMDIKPISITNNGVYLITGGSSGFGLELAKWLAHQGAKHLVLISRNGLSSEYARHTVAKIRRHGVDVEIREIDISDEKKVSNLIADIHSESAPLKGVFHCAMVLEDALMTTLREEDYARVLSPKVLGVIYLHQATAQLDLDYFVMTSSIASLVGNVGQANYIAANAFIDAFVYYRRKQKLPATTLNIGVLADVGVIARSKDLSLYTDLLAITKTPTHLVIKILSEMLKLNIPTLSIFDFDWCKWQKIDLKSAASSRFKNIVELAISEKTSDNETQNLLELLEESGEDAVEMISMLVKNCVAEVLRTDSAKVDMNANLNNMGIDSLMVSELKNKLIGAFDVEISLVELLKGVSVQDIAKLILTRLTHLA